MPYIAKIRSVQVPYRGTAPAPGISFIGQSSSNTNNRYGIVPTIALPRVWLERFGHAPEYRCESAHPREKIESREERLFLPFERQGDGTRFRTEGRTGRVSREGVRRGPDPPS